MIYAAVLLAAVLLYLAGFKESPSAQTIQQATISVDNVVIRHLSQDELLQGGTFAFDSRGFSYLVEYGNGEIRMKHASCPDQRCVNYGWLNVNNDLSVCMPGHVLIRYQSSAAPDTPVDAVTR